MRPGAGRLPVAVLLAFAACSVDRREVDSTEPDGSAASGGASLGGTSSGGASHGGSAAGGAASGGAPSDASSTGGVGTILGGAAGAGAGDAGTCTPWSEALPLSKPKVDVVLVVDTTASMSPILDELETGIKTLGVTLDASKIDRRIILLAEQSFCVPTPVGSGNCTNDSNGPGYAHYAVTIGDHDALGQVLTSYSTWKLSLRQGAAARHMLFVTDENSSMTSSDFLQQWAAKDAPVTTAWRMSAFVTQSACWNTFAIGTEYLKLVGPTGGTEIDLCVALQNPNAEPAGLGVKFGQFAASNVECRWDVSEKVHPIDAQDLAVEFVHKGLKVVPAYVGQSSSCKSADGGWWYDAGQQKVVACPVTCSQIRETATGALTVTHTCPK